MSLGRPAGAPARLAAGFLGLGAALRIYNFWGPDLWTDEYGTWWAVAGDWGEMTDRVIRYAGQSPLYYALVKLVTDALGASPATLRLLSVACGIVTVGLAYPLGTRIFGDRHPGVLAVAAFALSERFIWYSLEARPYALALLCTVLSFLAFVALLDSARLAHRVGYVVATLGAFYVHYLFGVAVLVQVLYLCLVRGTAWLRERAWAAMFLALGLLSLPGLAHLVVVFGRRQAMDWAPPNEAFAPVRLIIQFLEPAVFSAVAFAVLAVGREKESDAVRPGGQGLVLLWFLAPVVLFSVLPPLAGVNLLQRRYILVAAPAAILVVAWLMATARRTGWLRWVPVGVFVVTTFVWDLLPGLEASGTFARRPIQGWTKAARDLETHGRERDLVFLGTGFIEGDLLARPDPDPVLAAGLSWPLTSHLTSHLSGGPRYRILVLPATESERTRPYLASLLAQAAQTDRVWIIGVDDLVPRVARELTGGPGRWSPFRVRTEGAYGHVRVIVVAREGT